MKAGRIVLRVLLVVFGFGLALWIAGLFVPREHLAASNVVVAAPPDSVWARVRDFGQYAEWWSDATRMERLPQPDGREAWLQESPQGAIPFVVIAETPGSVVARIIDDDLPFGGTWTYQVDRVQQGSLVTITEAGFVKSPIFRVLGMLFFDKHATMDSYLSALAASFGSTGAPEHLDLMQ